MDARDARWYDGHKRKSSDTSIFSFTNIFRSVSNSQLFHLKYSDIRIMFHICI